MADEMGGRLRAKKQWRRASWLRVSKGTVASSLKLWDNFCQEVSLLLGVQLYGIILILYVLHVLAMERFGGPIVLNFN